MFALRGIAPSAGRLATLPRQAAMLQQRRGMAGGDEDESLYVNWWDNPYNPDLWKKHQLAWWAVAFWGAVFYTAFGGKKKEPAAAPAAAEAKPTAAH